MLKSFSLRWRLHVLYLNCNGKLIWIFFLHSCFRFIPEEGEREEIRERVKKAAVADDADADAAAPKKISDNPYDR